MKIHLRFKERMHEMDTSGDRLISEIQDVLGLTEYEAKIYLALAVHGRMTVSEISKLSGVPRAKCYEVLSGLVLKGLVVIAGSKPTKYEPLPLKEGFENRIAQMRGEIEMKAARSKLLIEDISKLKRGDFPRREVRVMILEGHDAIVASSINDASNAREEVLIALSSAPIKFEWKFYLPKLTKALLRGAKFRFLVPSISEFIGRIRNITVGVENPQAELRSSRRLKVPFMVIDRKITYLYITDPSLGVITMAIRIVDKNFGEQVRDIFGELWKLARPYNPSGDQVSEQAY